MGARTRRRAAGQAAAAEPAFAWVARDNFFTQKRFLCSAALVARHPPERAPGPLLAAARSLIQRGPPLPNPHAPASRAVARATQGRGDDTEVSRNELEADVRSAI